MATVVKAGWSKPSTILFATEYPPNQSAFSYALAQAIETEAQLVIFHVYANENSLNSLTVEPQSPEYALARLTRNRFEPLAERAKALGVQCRVVVRAGNAAEEILHYMREKRVDRLFLGAHTPGPVGRFLIGSVAEKVLRSAEVPVGIVGPFVNEDNCRNCATRVILCSLGTLGHRHAVVAFAAELAAKHRAKLVLQHVIPPQDTCELTKGRTLDEMTRDLRKLIAEEVREKIEVETHVVVGDPTEELLYQGRVRRASLIVLGAHDASHFAAITPASSVYKVLAYARCPVLTLSPVLLRGCGGSANERASYYDNDHFVAGVI